MYVTKDAYKGYVEDGLILHKLVYDVITKYLDKYIVKGLVYVEFNLGKGPDIIIHYGRDRKEEIESKNLCKTWWMSTGWVKGEVVDRYDEGSYKTVISTYPEIYTNRDREYFEENDIRLITVGYKVVSQYDKNVRSILYKKLYPIFKRIESYINNLGESVRSSVHSHYNTTSLYDYTNDIVLTDSGFIRLNNKVHRNCVPRPPRTSVKGWTV